MPVAKDLTELVEIDPKRVDRVKTPASGFPVLIMKSAAKDVDKKGNVNEAPDISNAEAVLRLLASLIESEAREMGAGMWDEICDIEMLTSAAYMIKCFRNREQWNAEDSVYKSLEDAISGRANELGVPNPMTDTSKETDVTDNNPIPVTDPTPTEVNPVIPDPNVEKSISDLVAEAVAKEVAPLIEVNKGLNAELAALKAKPIPGGPVITAAKATAVMDKSSTAEAARFEALSKSTSDRELSRYYAERAKEIREADSAK